MTLREAMDKYDIDFSGDVVRINIYYWTEEYEEDETFTDSWDLEIYLKKHEDVQVLEPRIYEDEEIWEDYTVPEGAHMNPYEPYREVREVTLQVHFGDAYDRD